MKNETRGRKPLKPDERKSLTRSVRMTPVDFKMLVDRFGSIQSFFDLALLFEREQIEKSLAGKLKSK